MVYYETGKGWHPLIEEALTKIRSIYPEVEIMQIKEKFASLRIYIGSVPKTLCDEIYAIIDEAEEQSMITCEECGFDGSVVNTSKYWIKTLCKECHAKR